MSATQPRASRQCDWVRGDFAECLFCCVNSYTMPDLMLRFPFHCRELPFPWEDDVRKEVKEDNEVTPWPVARGLGAGPTGIHMTWWPCGHRCVMCDDVCKGTFAPSTTPQFRLCMACGQAFHCRRDLQDPSICKSSLNHSEKCEFSLLEERC